MGQRALELALVTVLWVGGLNSLPFAPMQNGSVGCLFGWGVPMGVGFL